MTRAARASAGGGAGRPGASACKPPGRRLEEILSAWLADPEAAAQLADAPPPAPRPDRCRRPARGDSVAWRDAGPQARAPRPPLRDRGGAMKPCRRSPHRPRHLRVRGYFAIYNGVNLAAPRLRLRRRAQTAAPERPRRLRGAGAFAVHAAGFDPGAGLQRSRDHRSVAQVAHGAALPGLRDHRRQRRLEGRHDGGAAAGRCDCAGATFRSGPASPPPPCAGSTRRPSRCRRR